LQVPDAQVIIVGTHVDHPALSRSSLDQIRHQLGELLSEARGHHLSYFGAIAERLDDCLLCRTDRPPRCRSCSESSGTQSSQTEDAPTAATFINHAFDAGDTFERIRFGNVMAA